MAFPLFRTDDPIADFERYDAMKEERLERLPKCIYCDHPIQTEKLYVINDEFVCPDCLVEHHEKEVDYYVE